MVIILKLMHRIALKRIHTIEGVSNDRRFDEWSELQY